MELSTTTTTTTTTIDGDRIQEYAKKLSQSNFLETLALNVAMGIHAEITKRDETLEGFSPKCVNELEKFLKEQIVDDAFYLTKAEEILNHLTIWLQAGRTEENLWKNVALDSALIFLEPLDLSNRTLDELTAMLGLASKTVPATEPQLFISTTITQILTSAPPRTACKSLLRIWDWQEDTHKNVFFRDNYSTGFVKLALKDKDPVTKEYFYFTGKAAWGIIEEFGNLGKDTAKLHCLLSAYVFQQVVPWRTEIKLAGTGKNGGTNLIDLMGWGERKDMTTSQKLLRIEQCLKLLRRLDATIKWNIGKLGCDMNSLIWDVAVERYGQRNIFTDEIDEPTEIVAFIRAGRWAEFFFNKPGKNARPPVALYEFGWISEATLKMNPYHDELAFLIAINITTESALHTNGKYTVKTVLEMVMPKNEIEVARKDHRYAGKLKQRWDKALMQLAELDWQIIYDSETYPEWLRPGSTTGKPKDCKKRIIDLLLEAGVTIKPPGKIPALIAAKKSASLPRKRKSASAAPLEWEPIQKACEAKGWTKQTVIAEKLGISQQLVSQLQRGKSISPKTAAHLKKILPKVLPELSI